MKTRGLEPIVAAVLLIVVAVIGAVLVYLWFSGYVTRATSQAEQLSAAEQLKIEAVNVSKTNNKVYIYVRNVGDVPINVTSAYVLDSIKLTAVCTNTTVKTIVPPGFVKTIYIPSCVPNSGVRYIAKVVTARGTEAAATFISP